MKKIVVAFLIVSIGLIPKVVAQKPDDVVGYWLNIDNETKQADSQIQIYKDKSGNFCGKIVWLNEPNENGLPKLDNNNPDAKLKSRTILGLQLLNDFKFTGEIWENGTIYDPKSGNTYKCKLWFEDNKTGVLHLKGFIGISLIGREAMWIREYKNR